MKRVETDLQLDLAHEYECDIYRQGICTCWIGEARDEEELQRLIEELEKDGDE